MKRIILFLLLTLSLLLVGCTYKDYVLSEKDIRIEKFNYTDNFRTCSEIEELMKTSEIARYDGYNKPTELTIWINPEYKNKNILCTFVVDSKKDNYLNFKTGTQMTGYRILMNMSKSHDLQFCCYIADNSKNKLSNEVCAKKFIEKIC